ACEGYLNPFCYKAQVFAALIHKPCDRAQKALLNYLKRGNPMTLRNHIRFDFLTMMIASVFALVLAAPIFGQQAATATIEGAVTLTVGQKLNLDLGLRVNVSEAVNITDVAPIVETTRSNVSASVGERAVKGLPVNGRNFLDFVTLTPGVVRDPRGGDLSFGG